MSVTKFVEHDHDALWTCFKVGEFDTPEVLLSNPDSQFAKMITAAASVQDQERKKDDTSKSQRSSQISSHHSTPSRKHGERNVAFVNDENDASQEKPSQADKSGSYDNDAYTSDESDDEFSHVTSL